MQHQKTLEQKMKKYFNEKTLYLFISEVRGVSAKSISKLDPNVFFEFSGKCLQLLQNYVHSYHGKLMTKIVTKFPNLASSKNALVNEMDRCNMGLYVCAMFDMKMSILWERLFG